MKRVSHDNDLPSKRSGVCGTIEIEDRTVEGI